ncbi:MAG: class I SAM-dependent methyltransferase [Acidobacteriota bacterium]
MPERDWVEYFSGTGSDPARWFLHWQYHTPLVDLLRQALPPGSRILDIGCGVGDTALLLAGFGYQVTGIDIEEPLVDRAREAAARLHVTAAFERGDLRDLAAHHGRFDATLSLGLMEHFDFDDAAGLLAEQARCAPRVIVNIPSVWAALSLPFVDERPYTLRSLERLGRAAGLVPEVATGYGDVRGRRLHDAVRQVAPRGLYRWFQKRGYANSITAIFRRPS